MKRMFIALALVCLFALPAFAAPQSGWEIVRADYGWGNNWVDVTERVRSLVQGDSLAFTVNSDTLGTSERRGRNRTLRLELKNSNGRTRQMTYRENQQVRLQVFNTYAGGLHINRATYAYGTRSLDVTSRLNAQIQGEQLHLQVTNQNMGGDPAPGEDKTLTVNYVISGRNQQSVVREGDTLHLTNGNVNPGQGTLQIDRATYGSNYRNVDVTTRLNSQVRGNQLNLQVNSDTMGGDPAPGRAKRLTVQYAVNGQRNEIVVNEGDMLRLNGGSYSGYPQGNQQDFLKIERATYGAGYRTVDVTNRLTGQVRGGQLNLQVNSDSMGSDPAPGQNKSLTVEYTVNGRTNQTVVNDGDMLRLNSGTYQSSQNGLQINRATYGAGFRSADVTSRLNSQIRDNQLNLQVNSNTMGSDPAPGQVKSVTVEYTANGQTNQTVVRDGATLQLSSSVGTSSSGLAQRFNCESLPANGYGRTNCAANRGNEVRFVRQLGETQCTQNRTWGFDANGVWVDQGCRAEFEVLGRARRIGSNSTGDITGSTTLMSGSELSIRTNELIDSTNANVGQTFSATVASDVLNSSGAVIIPRGADARLVIRSTDGGGVTSASELVLDVDSLTVNGTKYTISTSDLEQQGGQGVGANKKTAILVGGGAALGTLIGAIVGGGKGAAIGAAIGAGGGLGATVLTRGKQVRVPAETLLNFRLDQDLRLQAGR